MVYIFVGNGPRAVPKNITGRQAYRNGTGAVPYDEIRLYSFQYCTFFIKYATCNKSIIHEPLLSYSFVKIVYVRKEMNLMYNANLIDFRRLDIYDLENMHKWFNNDFVIEWFSKKKWTFKEIEEKYLPYINNEKPTQGYLILYDNTPIGYIQTYKIHDYQDYARFVDINENASGLDLFIGEQEFIHKGLGKDIIIKFLKEIVFSLSDSISCVLGPEPKNEIAIKTYKKVGFKYLKTIQIDDEDEPEYIMRISKNEITQA